MSSRGIKLTKEDYQCPVCLVVPKSTPIYQCANGHIICKSCYPHLEKCPVCRIDLLPHKIRCLVAENIIPLLPRNCIFSGDGCDEPEKSDSEMLGHEKNCEYRAIYLANAETKDQEKGELSISRACMFNQVEKVKLLLQDLIESKTMEGHQLTLFQWHCFKHNVKMTEVLLEFLVSNASNLSELAKAKDKDGRTLLHIAFRYGHVDVAKLLLPISDANAKNRLGQTPLIEACIHDNDDVVELAMKGYPAIQHLDNLFGYGIDSEELDEFGNDAYDYGLHDILRRIQMSLLLRLKLRRLHELQRQQEIQQRQQQEVQRQQHSSRSRPRRSVRVFRAIIRAIF